MINNITPTNQSIAYYRRLIVSQEFKMLKRDELIDIFYQVFIEEYQVSSSLLKDDSEIVTLESNYDGVYDRWIAQVFDGMGMDYLDYDLSLIHI